MRLSSETLWNEVIAQARDELVVRAEQAIGERRDMIADTISKTNRPLYGFAPALVMAAVLGTKLIEESPEHPNLLTDKAPKPMRYWKDAIEIAARHFDTPATNMDELMTRIHELFPSEHADNASLSPFSFFNILKKAGTFDHDRKCIVQNPTLYFFEAYGRALNGDYGKQFGEAIKN